MVSIFRCQRSDPGSIPGSRISKYARYSYIKQEDTFRGVGQKGLSGKEASKRNHGCLLGSTSGSRI